MRVRVVGAALLVLAHGAAEAAALDASGVFVNCGGHYAGTCAECIRSQSGGGCEGECVLLQGECQAAKVAQAPGVPTADTSEEAAEVQADLDHKAGRHSSSPSTLDIAGFVISSCIAAFFADLYKRQVVSKLPRDKILIAGDAADELRTLRYREAGLFDCFREPSTCAYACLCGPTLASKNYSSGKVLRFWPSCVILHALAPFYCCNAVVRTVLSSRLKRNMGLQGSPLKDFFLNLCCLPCEVGRESLEVDEALEVEIRCFNKVTSVAVPEPPSSRPADSGYFPGACFLPRTCGP